MIFLYSNKFISGGKKKMFYFHIERGIEYGGEWINKSERERCWSLFSFYDKINSKEW
jgi:hypothetical protein